MNRVAILGLGLMGGSLGLALKARGFPGKLAGYARREDTRALALRKGVVDEALAHPEDAVRGADLVVCCVPILSIPDLVGACRRSFHHRCVVTDVGSTKADLHSRVAPILQGTSAVYVGSHPIAGSEKQGLEAARPDLYEGAVVVVTQVRGEPSWAVEAVRSFWTGLGAVVRSMNPREHDGMMARTSHLPHLASVLLAKTVGREGDPAAAAEFCGTGFRDTARIAGGSPDVWRDIIETNRDFVADELSAFRKELDQLSQAVVEGDFGKVEEILGRARDCQRALSRADASDGERHEEQ